VLLLIVWSGSIEY